ncbi:MAG: ABC transporter permease [Parvularculaceae bacterium]
MKAVALIALREYKQYVLSRGFFLFLLMFPLAVVLSGAAIAMLERSKPVRSFIVVDQAGGFADAIDREIVLCERFGALYAWDAYATAAIDPKLGAAEDLPAPFAPAPATHARLRAVDAAGGYEAGQTTLAALLRTGAPRFAAPKSQFLRLAALDDAGNAATTAAAAEILRPYLIGQADYPGAGGEVFAAVLIPAGFGVDPDAEVEYWSRNLTDPALENVVQSALDRALMQRMAQSYGLGDDRLEALSDINATMTAYRPNKIEGGAALEDSDRIRTAFLPAAMTYLLLVVVFGAGNLLLTNTIEERSNKVVEVLLSTVSADQLMYGKLLGVAAVGLTMPAVFVIGGAVLAVLGLGGGAPSEVMNALFSSHLLFIYLFYFFCAYLIFAMIFLAIGAISNSLQDAQSYLGPVMLIVFAPLPFMVMVFQNPNGLIATILTWIPIYTPYAVMMRAAADPPVGEIIGATCLMLAVALLLARVMGRIFRQGILQSSPVKARDLWRLAKSERD